MKRHVAHWFLVWAGLLLSSHSALAQDYPNKPIKLVVGYVPGGSPDSLARILGEQLTQILGQQIIVDNRPGAGGTLASAAVAKAPADGYTLMVGETGQMVIAPYLMKGLPYDPVKDFTPIGLVGSTPLVLAVNPKTSKLKTVKDLIREAKANPGKLSYGSSGIGSIHHVAAEVFKADAGIDLLHVPYKGTGQSVPGLLAGDVPVLMTSLTGVLSHVRAGTVNLLAVSSATRYPGTPDTPTIGETIKGYDYSSEMGILAPANLPPPILDKLVKAVREAAGRPDLQEKMKAASIIVNVGTPEAYAENIRQNLKKYERAVKLANVQAN